MSCMHDAYLCARIVYLSVRLSVRLPVFLLAFMFAFACTSAFLPICLNVCRMSACMSVCLPAFFNVYTLRPRSTASKGVVFVCLRGCVCLNLLYEDVLEFVRVFCWHVVRHLCACVYLTYVRNTHMIACVLVAANPNTHQRMWRHTKTANTHATSILCYLNPPLKKLKKTDIYSLLHLQCCSISILNLNLVVHFSTERREGDVEN